MHLREIKIYERWAVGEDFAVYFFSYLPCSMVVNLAGQSCCESSIIISKRYHILHFLLPFHGWRRIAFDNILSRGVRFFCRNLGGEKIFSAIFSARGFFLIFIKAREFFIYFSMSNQGAFTCSEASIRAATKHTPKFYQSASFSARAIFILHWRFLLS